MNVQELPLVNAILNGSSALLLTIGYTLIRRKKTRHHHRVMIAAFCLSCLFLLSYLVYHASVGSVAYTGQGWARTVYFAILISHSILAASVPPLAIITLVRAARQKFERHRRLARWTLPIWLYVSFTGVVIYLMLYRF
jgi:putative membrane protein